MNFRNILYASTCLSFSVIIGAAIYEHTALWPSAFAELPKSLTVFQGAYHLDAAPFWKSIHPVTLLLFVITSVVTWKTNRRKHVLVAIGGYVIILLTTFAYFVPELLELTGTPYSDTVDASLQLRADRWVTLSLIRLALLLVLAMNLLIGLTKAESNSSATK